MSTNNQNKAAKNKKIKEDSKRNQYPNPEEEKEEATLLEQKYDISLKSEAEKRKIMEEYFPSQFK